MHWFLRLGRQSESGKRLSKRRVVVGIAALRRVRCRGLVSIFALIVDTCAAQFVPKQGLESVAAKRFDRPDVARSVAVIAVVVAVHDHIRPVTGQNFRLAKLLSSVVVALWANSATRFASRRWFFLSTIATYAGVGCAGVGNDSVADCAARVVVRRFGIAAQGLVKIRSVVLTAVVRFVVVPAVDQARKDCGLASPVVQVVDAAVVVRSARAAVAGIAGVGAD